MSEMIERVAQALHEHGVGRGYTWGKATQSERDSARVYAVAAIEAMRTPTRTMTVAGQDNVAGCEDVNYIYAAMIGVALKERKE